MASIPMKTTISSLSEGDMNEPRTWLFIQGAEVPAAWQSRAVTGAFVPLLPEEAALLMGGGTPQPALSGDELALARLAARGMSNAAMARELGIAERTVYRRLNQLRERFGFASKGDLISFLATTGLAG